MTDATFTATCARCAAPLEITDATADAVSKAHEERCFVVGDAVGCRVHAGKWWPATISGVVSQDDFEVEHIDLMGTRSWWRASRANLRRIPRPEREVKALSVRLAERDLAAHRDVLPANVPPDFETERERLEARAIVDPLDVTYDGVMLRTLLDGDEFNRREPSSHWKAKRMTPAQRAAVSAHWSAQLRAKLAASSERERLTVVAPDLELETANCKDAE